MSKMEILILILSGLIPLFSFFIAFKPILKNLFKKKEKQNKSEIKEDVKQEEKPEEIRLEPIKEKTLNDEIKDSFCSSDYKDYAMAKKENITFPERKYNKNYLPTLDLEEYDHVRPKTIVEQIKSLSPELKALIVAGVLDKKDIDNI